MTITMARRTLPDGWQHTTLPQIARELGVPIWAVAQPVREHASTVEITTTEQDGERVIRSESQCRGDHGPLDHRAGRRHVADRVSGQDARLTLDVVLELAEARRYSFDPTLAELTTDVGDDGVVALEIPRRPVSDLLHEYLGWAEGLMLFLEERDKIEAIIDVLEEKLQAFVDSLAMEESPIVYSPDNLDGQFISPRMFQDHLAGSYRRTAETLHRQGKLLVVHIGGPVRRLLSPLADAGVDGLEGIAGPPQSDAGLAEARNLVGADCLLWGGISQDHLIETRDRADLDHAVAEAVQASAGDPRMIIGVADRVPVDADLDRLLALPDLIARASFDNMGLLSAGRSFGAAISLELSMTNDLLIRNVRPNGKETADVLITGGRIEQISPQIETPDGPIEIIDGDNQLLLPGLVDAHAHLDKNLLGLPWHPNQTPGTRIRDFVDNERAVRSELNLSAQVQSARQVEAAVAAGTTHIRSHVDIDTEAGLAHFEGVLATREAYRDAVTMQLVAFPQSGMLVRPGTVELLEEAVRMGAECIGGLDPSTVDRDPVRHLDTIFAIADRHGVEVDIHLHEPGMLGAFAVELIAERTKALGLQGRVTISHVFCLGMVDDAYLDQLIDLLLENRIAIMSLASGKLAVSAAQASARCGRLALHRHRRRARHVGTLQQRRYAGAGQADGLSQRFSQGCGDRDAARRGDDRRCDGDGRRRLRPRARAQAPIWSSCPPRRQPMRWWNVRSERL